jgi:hypothetical protein
MKLSESLTLAALGMGCPLLIFGSTLYGSASCQLNKQAGVILPLGRKSDAYALLLLAGAAQGGLAGWLGYCIFKKEQAEELLDFAPSGAHKKHSPSLPPAHTQTIEVPAEQPEGELIRLNNTQIQASSNPEAIYTIPSQPRSEFSWGSDLLGYPTILIYGAQGAGKTTFSAWLIRERRKAGHQIKILDPHREFAQWDGLEVYGDGMDYEAIDCQLAWFTSEIKKRYGARAQSAHYKPQPITVLCEEFTSWSDRCESSSDFFRESLSDIRKIGLHVIFVSHARTLTGLGGSKGLAATRDAGLLELELEAQVDPVTKKASPALRGKLKYPGLAERKAVAIAPWMKGDMNFKEPTQEVTEGVTPPENPELSSLERNLLEALYHNSPEFQEKEVTGSSSAENSPLPLTKELFDTVTTLMKLGGMKPSQIIKDCWGYKGRNYSEGKALFDQLMDKFGGEAPPDDDTETTDTEED